MYLEDRVFFSYDYLQLPLLSLLIHLASPHPTSSAQSSRPTSTATTSLAITHLSDDNDTYRVLGPPLPIPFPNEELVAAAHHSTQLFLDVLSLPKASCEWLWLAQTLRKPKVPQAKPGQANHYTVTSQNRAMMWDERVFPNGRQCLASPVLVACMHSKYIYYISFRCEYLNGLWCIASLWESVIL